MILCEITAKHIFRRRSIVGDRALHLYNSRAALCALICVGLILLSSSSFGAAAPTAKAVLLVFPYQVDLPQTVLAQRAIQTELDNASDLRIEWHYEYLDLNRFPDQEYQQQIIALLATRYRHKAIDLVFVAGEQALSFWLRHRHELLTDTPVVFYDILPESSVVFQQPPGVTGLISEIDHTQLLTWVPQLHHEVAEIMLVHGVGKADREFNAPLDILQDELEGQIRLYDWSTLPFSEIKKRAATLSSGSMIFYQLMFEDVTGVKHRPIDVLRELLSVSTVPIVSKYDQFLGLGTIGGYLYSLEQVAGEAARIGVRILRGEAATGIPIATYQSNRFIFDHRALLRWEIPLSDLPEDSVIKFRQHSLWEHRSPLFGIGVILSVLSLLTVSLGIMTRRLHAARQAMGQFNVKLERQVQERTAALSQTNQQMKVEIAERKKAEKALKQSEHLYHTLVELMNEGLAMTNERQEIVYLSDQCCRILGIDQTLVGKPWEGVWGDSAWKTIKAQFAQRQSGVRDPYEVEHLCRDGQVRTIHISPSPIFDEDGYFRGSIALFQDITERKQAKRLCARAKKNLPSPFIPVRSLCQFRLLTKAATWMSMRRFYAWRNAVTRRSSDGRLQRCRFGTPLSAVSNS